MREELLLTSFVNKLQTQHRSVSESTSSDLVKGEYLGLEVPEVLGCWVDLSETVFFLPFVVLTLMNYIHNMIFSNWLTTNCMTEITAFVGSWLLTSDSGLFR